MKEMIISLFGQYEPVSYYETVLATAADGTVVSETFEVIVSGAAGLDWPWIMGVLLFAIVLYSLFRILGVFFK